MIRFDRFLFSLIFAVWLGLSAAAQSAAPYRVTDQEMKPLLKDLEESVKKFQGAAKDKLKNTTLATGAGDASVKQYVQDLRDAVKRLKDDYGDRSTAAEAESVFLRAGYINRFMQANPLVTGADRQWAAVKGNLDRLGQAYGVTWGNEGAAGRPGRLDDKQLKKQLDQLKKAGEQYRDTLDKALAQDPAVDKKMRENARDALKNMTDSAGKLKDKLADPLTRDEANKLAAEILRTGDAISTFMGGRALPGSVKTGWAKLRAQLGAVAAAFNVPWQEEKEAVPAE
jgi:hypothetical protein